MVCMDILINWPTYDTLENSATKLNTALQSWNSPSLLLAVSYPFLLELPEKISAQSVTYGANSMNRTADGTFTRSIAAQILKKAGAQFVIVGSSLARKITNDNENEIQAKVTSALLNGLQVYLCVGESAEERKEGKSVETLKTQISQAYLGLEPIDQARISLIYEGPWATCSEDYSAEEIQESHQNFQEAIKGAFPETEVKAFVTIPSFSPSSRNGRWLHRLLLPLRTALSQPSQ